MPPSKRRFAMAAYFLLCRSGTISGRAATHVTRRRASTTTTMAFLSSSSARSAQSYLSTSSIPPPISFQNQSAHRNRFSCTARPSTTSPTAESTTTTPLKTTSTTTTTSSFKINLLTTPLAELQSLLKSWNFPSFHAKQIHHWIFQQGIQSIDDMTNLPLALRTTLHERASIGSLVLDTEQISIDGTKKRAYKLHDGQLIESVLMPYEDGRRTACISSQAGCAMGCVFCATGQMGFARQLTSEEIFEQVARFASELKGSDERLSNVVMMGMGEPLANYRNVLAAIHRMNTDLGISARKITVSTVGIVPNIKKLMEQDLPVRLALSLHCATDEERSALLPANKRYGGLAELMSTIREYIRVKKSRVTLEWALIEGQNDSKDVARTLGRLLQTHDIRSDMVHVNLIPLNPTGGYGGGPSGRQNVQQFVQVLEREFGVTATPRMRRGIDIDAGCGQLTASVKKNELGQGEVAKVGVIGNPMVGVYEDEDDNEYDVKDEEEIVDAKLESDDDDLMMQQHQPIQHGSVVDFLIDDAAINLDDEEEAESFADPTYEDEFELAEAERLIALVKGSSLSLSPPTPIIEEQDAASTTTTTTSSFRQPNTKSTTITDEDAIREAKRRRKKLLKNLKAIQKLKDMEVAGKELNEEQLEKISKEGEWNNELESVEHNLM